MRPGANNRWLSCPQYSLALPKIIAARTVSEATVREKLDCIQSLLDQIKTRKEANTHIDAILMMIRSASEAYLAG